MFPSAANGGYFVDPFISLPFSSDITTKQDQDPLLLPFSSFSIPSSPFYLYHDQEPAAFPPTSIDDCTTITVVADAVMERSQKEKEVIPKKRSAKKDRHSKINTAQGPRDRRMRLSLEVARKFFDLQDMLEFDKASKTVEWLLKQSKSAIKEITRNWKRQNGNGSPCSSECDVVSGVSDESMDASKSVIDDFDKFPEIPAKKEKKIVTRTQKCRGIVARESRKQARARAKERTIEKMWIRKLTSSLSDPSASEEIGTNQILEFVEESGTAAGHNYSYMMKPSNMEEVAQMDEAKKLGLMQEQMEGNSYSFIGTYFQNNGISQEHPFSDLQMLPKPWESFSNSCQQW